MRATILLTLLLGCATLGTETSFPSAVTTSGVGPFRQLERYETGAFRSPPGQAVNTGGLLVGNAAAGGGQLFYVAATPLDEPPERDPSLPSYAVDWAQADARAIYRASPSGFAGTLNGRPVSLPGFDVGERVLEATQAWEGAAVFDPCPLVLPDGRLRLYYAAEGGIGVAEAD
ncbi:MAG: hypothetical protein GXP55_03490, partial [Deltaproteobacteria bacterium]|nr:hypothetical protein [Deltaproteobacteria bacterium]